VVILVAVVASQAISSGEGLAGLPGNVESLWHGDWLGLGYNVIVEKENYRFD